jgi:hypothetical protein
MEKFKNQESFWQKTKEIGKIAAFVALLGTAGVESALAQESKGSEVDLRNKIEQLKQQAAEEEKTLEILMSQMNDGVEMGGREYRENDGTYTKTTFKEMKDSLGGKIQVGYDQDGKTPSWISLETPDAVKRYLDANNDGLLDRVILNHGSDSPQEKSGTNGFIQSLDVEMLDGIAHGGSLAGKEDTILTFGTEGGKSKVQLTGFKNGERAYLLGTGASDFTYKMQQDFLSALRGFHPKKQE